MILSLLCHPHHDTYMEHHGQIVLSSAAQSTLFRMLHLVCLVGLFTNRHATREKKKKSSLPRIVRANLSPWYFLSTDHQLVLLLIDRDTLQNVD